jgi:putative spermidine/putrescine transport system ATP-binding protein
MAFLELQGLSKRYGDFTAVADCSLSVSKGEFVCLLGPSGCGKTTTLQMVAASPDRPKAGSCSTGRTSLT